MDKWINFNNIGYFSFEFTEEQMTPVKNEIRSIQNNWDAATPRNKTLQGHIQKEYALSDECKDYLQKLLMPHLIEYDTIYKYIHSITPLTKNVPIVLDQPWVNFQKKHEFNPPHSHSGILSYVIWIKVPFKMEDELKVFPDAVAPNTACFNFLHLNSVGQMQPKTLYIDQTFENSGIMFPSSMFHYVNPFYTSDDYRISISGNFKLDV